MLQKRLLSHKLTRSLSRRSPAEELGRRGFVDEELVSKSNNMASLRQVGDDEPEISDQGRRSGNNAAITPGVTSTRRISWTIAPALHQLKRNQTKDQLRRRMRPYNHATSSESDLSSSGEEEFGIGIGGGIGGGMGYGLANGGGWKTLKDVLEGDARGYWKDDDPRVVAALCPSVSSGPSLDLDPERDCSYELKRFRL